MPSAKHPLDSVETRLGCRFPTSFRATFVGEKVFTEIENWQIHDPNEIMRTSPDYGAPSPNVVGVEVGCDVGGNRLLLRFGPDGQTLLEPLWSWDHETRELAKVAKELAALLDPEGDAAFAKYANDSIAEMAEREEYWDRIAKENLDDGGVCKFCGSGLAGETVCSVCTRRADEPDDRKNEVPAHFREAARIVGLLMSDGRLELVSANAKKSVIDITARMILAADGGLAPADVAAKLLEGWDDTAEIAEVFIDEDELVPIVAARG